MSVSLIYYKLDMDYFCRNSSPLLLLLIKIFLAIICLFINIFVPTSGFGLLLDFCTDGAVAGLVKF